MTISVYPYKQGSASAAALGFTVLKTENSRYHGGPHKLVVNWGASEIRNEEVFKSNILNKPEAVGLVADKLKFFNWCSSNSLYSIPPYTTDILDVGDWLEGGSVVLARTKLNGHSGDGIVVIDDVDNIVDAPLYTMYIKKKSEFRVHFFKGDVIFIQQKVRRLDHPEDAVNWQIRNHANGFNYAWNNVNAPDAVYNTVYELIEKLPLDFGAIDIIYNEKSNTAYILEVNSAPGLEGETGNVYRRVISSYYNNEVTNPAAKAKYTNNENVSRFIEQLRANVQMQMIDDVVRQDPNEPIF